MVADQDCWQNNVHRAGGWQKFITYEVRRPSSSKDIKHKISVKDIQKQIRSSQASGMKWAGNWT